MRHAVRVYGPAYLDRVVRVAEALHPTESRRPLDQSIPGQWKFGPGLMITAAGEPALRLAIPDRWAGPTGIVELETPLALTESKFVSVESHHDDLGGMGAGFAAALGAKLTCILGDASDPTTTEIERLLAQAGIEFRPLRVNGQPSDWTLLLTSGPFGDKLAIGFRSCHTAASELTLPPEDDPCDLRIVAGLPNRLAEAALSRPGARIRMLAPSLRNMISRDPPVGRLARSVDVLSCNRNEWESLDDREQVAWQLSVLIITDGCDGSRIRFTTPEGESCQLHVPAFPREAPPCDTNRAGEAFASAFAAELLDSRWQPGSAEESLIRAAGQRASAAAGLVLDLEKFGFPSREMISLVIARGGIPGPSDNRMTD
ncbi:MAG: PfkB family carbohydrate kinase [Isosphaeraceae bacterium]